MTELDVAAGRHRVVVVGGGFGGLQTALNLRAAPVELTLVDRRNFHLFQPLTYQVATGALSPSEVAYPLRAIFRRDRHVRVMLGEVTGFDLDHQRVTLATAPGTVGYDTLVVASGSHYSYFGHDEWRKNAPEVKSLESALDLRGRILGAFEAAELESDPDRRRSWLTFVVVGAGPTGVEMSGQIAEIVHDFVRRDFRTIDPSDARVLLVEGADRVLTTFPRSLSKKAARSLRSLGVTPVLGRMVVDVAADAVSIQSTDGATVRVPARTVVWAAGVEASQLARRLAEATRTGVDRAGRIAVEPDLTLPGHPEVFAIGDMVSVRGVDGAVLSLPGVAPVAMQQGRYVATVVRNRIEGRPTPPFRYRDKGNLATIGRARAVADVKGVHLSGFIAWLTWLVVHLWYLIGFQNRIVVLVRWSFSFITRGRSARLITDDRRPAPEDT
ncbi:MAG: NAD(P)/FAD-dependent oxidoreductase [Nocardioidaceae bacterium]